MVPLPRFAPMKRRTCLLAAVLMGFAPILGAQGQPAVAPGADGRKLDLSRAVAKVDFDGMLERRAIRIYVPYSRSLYFVDKGRERGIAADLIRAFERWVNQKHAAKLGKRPLTVFAIVVTRDRMLEDLTGG